jgi:hypothetical protein
MAAALQQPLAAAGPGAVIPLDMAPSQPAVAQALYQLEYDDFDHYCSLFCQQKGVCMWGGRGLGGACKRVGRSIVVCCKHPLSRNHRHPLHEVPCWVQR